MLPSEEVLVPYPAASMTDLRDKLSDLPDHHRCYVPDLGEVTLGMIRDSSQSLFDRRLNDLEEEERCTVAMWGYIGTRPDEKPWKDPKSPFWALVSGWERWRPDWVEWFGQGSRRPLGH